MGIKTTDEQAERIVKLNCTFRFAHQSERYAPSTMNPNQPIKIGDGCTICDIFDLTTNEMYAHGKAGPFQESEALDDALTNAENAAKPLTAAQRSDMDRRSNDHQLNASKLRAAMEENEALKKELEALRPKKKEPAPESPVVPVVRGANARHAAANKGQARAGLVKKVAPGDVGGSNMEVID